MKIIIMAFAVMMLGYLASCTISFQNISTHGTATDLVDENQTASPKVSAKISAPIPTM